MASVIVELKKVTKYKNPRKKAMLVETNPKKITGGLFPHEGRMYQIHTTDASEIRGNHYHLKNAEIMMCPAGGAILELHSEEKCNLFLLDSPEKAVIVAPETWHAVKIEANSILMVIASKEENETDTFEEYFECFCGQCGQLLAPTS